ncbi:hypothetical protein FOS14_22260 [Skermania sp. ID1734]|uniref:hypothetical protein n=1 Tax=Skermania sp. ID1734 TaxID=2597516 RepID=UPI00117CA436|nr:hypothetical protein [Skermania sp. ID1734]TSD93784.1 hypothetical protein FOS14_22260 [Skermania sp. ID1734]
MLAIVVAVWMLAAAVVQCGVLWPDRAVAHPPHALSVVSGAGSGDVVTDHAHVTGETRHMAHGFLTAVLPRIDSSLATLLLGGVALAVLSGLLLVASVRPLRGPPGGLPFSCGGSAILNHLCIARR